MKNAILNDPSDFWELNSCMVNVYKTNPYSSHSEPIWYGSIKTTRDDLDATRSILSRRLYIIRVKRRLPR